MASFSQPSPGFGTADLSNCEREQIHLAGSIQTFGALLVLREPDLTIVQASVNADRLLGLGRPALGSALSAIPGNLSARLRPHLDNPALDDPIGIRCRLGHPLVDFVAMVHRPKGGGLIVELEPSGPRVDLSQAVQGALASIVSCSSLPLLCDDTARIVRDLSGYDRVMVYRFDEEGHGQVFTESKRGDLDPFLGNWYPASDIPQIARRLYERNRVRLLMDVAYAPVPLAPQRSPLSGQDLDMSMCFLRSMSPIHIQYLKNMGVCATLVVSLMVNGKLWGLIACHHYEPRIVSFDVRAACELLAEVVATRIAALDAFVQGQAELSVRRLEQRMVRSISTAGDWRAALFDESQALLAPLEAEGAALLLDNEVMTTGDVPGTLQIRAVGAWMAQRPPAPITATASLQADAPDLAALMPDIGGILGVPISNSPGDCLIWFRPERVRTVTWGGNPTKPFTVGNDPRDLSPRRSFAQWHELVEGTCEPWTAANVRTGRLIGETVSDVVVQFRSVRTLIVQDQLDSVGRQVRASEQPIVIADAKGKVVLTNQAFDTLVTGRPLPAQLADLPGCFADAASVDHSLKQMMLHRRPWRGEAMFLGTRDAPVPLLVRADPVLSAPGRVLGFVILMMDISERQAVETARRQFQEGLGAPHRPGARPHAAAADPLYDALVSSVIENAQVAALEITDGLDMARIPETLESITSSVGRAVDVIERLAWHAGRAANDDG